MGVNDHTEIVKCSKTESAGRLDNDQEFAYGGTN